jgi:hypothetical protein
LNTFVVSAASANLGNAAILEMDSWIPKNAPHTDLVVFGLQESTYYCGVEKLETVNDEVQKSLEEEVGNALVRFIQIISLFSVASS